MSLKFDWITVDCADPKAVAEFWAQALDDYEVFEDPDEDEDLLVLPKSRRGPKILFQKVPEGKKVKNRMHFDIRPEDSDRDTEVARLEKLGTTRADVGQNDDEVTWTVMADVEGNEFCVLRALSDEEIIANPQWTW